MCNHNSNKDKIWQHWLFTNKVGTWETLIAFFTRLKWSIGLEISVAMVFPVLTEVSGFSLETCLLPTFYWSCRMCSYASHLYPDAASFSECVLITLQANCPFSHRLHSAELPRRTVIQPITSQTWPEPSKCFLLCGFCFAVVVLRSRATILKDPLSCAAAPDVGLPNFVFAGLHVNKPPSQMNCRHF